MAMGQLNLRTVKLGDNVDTSKNFLIQVPAVADGTLTISRESGTAVASIDAAGKVVFPGNAQTWQDVKASRAFGTTYTNLTTLPITVCVSGEGTTSASSARLSPVVDGASLTPFSTYIPTGNVGYLVTASFVVPAGKTYSVGQIQAALSAATQWMELR